MAAWYTANFSAWNNADFSHSFRVRTVGGVAIDLTGATLEMDIRTKGDTQVATATAGNGRLVIVDAANGLFTLKFTAAELAAIPVGTYVQDLVIVHGGVRSIIWRGAFTINAGVTR